MGELRFAGELEVGSWRLGVAVQIPAGFDFIRNPEDFNRNSPLPTPNSQLKQRTVHHQIQTISQFAALPRFPYCPDGLPPGVRPLQAGPLVHPAQPQPQPPERRVFTVCRTAKNTMMARAAMSTMSMSFIITSFWSVSNGKWQMGNGDGRCRPVISQVTGQLNFPAA